MPPRANQTPSLRSRGAALLAAILAQLLLLGVAFGHWTATSPWAFPRFLAALVLLVYLPGRVVLELTRLELRPLERLCLSLQLGAVASTAIYGTLAWLGVPRIFAAWPAAALVAAVLQRLRGHGGPLRSDEADAQDSRWLVALVPLGLLPLAVLPFYYPSFALQADGSMNAHPLLELTRHLGVSNDLTHSVPPRSPGFPWKPLNYHHGIDFLTAMFISSAGLDAVDLTVRFLPSFFVTLTLLTAFVFSRRWLGSAASAALCTFLTLLGEDFSFIPGWFVDAPLPWSYRFFGLPATMSLYHGNPMLPGLGLLFAALLALSRYLADGKRNWILVAPVLVAGLLECKVFTAAHLFAALGLTGLVYWLRDQDSRPLILACAVGLLSLPSAGRLLGAGDATGWVRPVPWPYVSDMVRALHLGDTRLGGAALALSEAPSWHPSTLVAFFGVALPAFIVGALGMRVVAIPTVVGILFSVPRRAPARFALAAFIALGIVLTLVFTVTPPGYPPRTQVNNSLWFFLGAKYLLWVLVVERLQTLWHGKRAAAWLSACVLLALSLPSSLEYLAFMRARLPGQNLPNSEMQMIRFLRGRICPGAVLFARDDVAKHILCLTRCRAWVPTMYPSEVLSPVEMQRELQDREDFWSGWAQNRPRFELLTSRGVDYVAVDRRRDPACGSRCPDKAVFDNGAFALYAVPDGGVP